VQDKDRLRAGFKQNGQQQKLHFGALPAFRGESLVNINIEVPDEIHKRIKILSAIQGIPIKELIATALEESVGHEK
jgi:hypothetical protein